MADQHADLDWFPPPEVMVLDQISARKDVKLVDTDNDGEKPEELVEELEVELAADDKALGIDNEKVSCSNTDTESEEGELDHEEADLEREGVRRTVRMGLTETRMLHGSSLSPSAIWTQVSRGREAAAAGPVGWCRTTVPTC